MRMKRIDKYKYKKQTTKRIIIWLFVVIPILSVLLGYIITKVVIVPNL